MARRKNKPEAVQEKNQLAERLRLIRCDLFGERGGSEMARRLGLPVRTWYNYETGVTVPAEIILRFVELTAVEPMWLLHGRGPRYRHEAEPAFLGGGGGDTVRDLLRTALQRLEQRDAGTDPTARLMTPRHPNRRGSGSLAALFPAADSGQRPSDELAPVALPSFLPAEGAGTPAPESNQAYRCVRVNGEAMMPILSDGAYVVYSEHEDPPQRLGGQLVVAWVDNQMIVRWFELSGRYGILRAENQQADPQSILVDLQAPSQQIRLRRVVGTSTPH